MSFTVETEDKYKIVRCVATEIDGMLFGEMEEELKDYYAVGDHLLIDFLPAKSITSEAVDALLDRAERQMEAQKTFVLINNSAEVVQAFDDNLALIPTEHDAVDYFNFDELERQYEL